jgi:hypothetical protein
MDVQSPIHTKLNFGKYKGWTYQEFIRSAPPTYIKWVRDTVRSGNDTCRGLAELHHYIVSVSQTPVEVMPTGLRPDGGDASGSGILNRACAASNRAMLTYV